MVDLKKTGRLWACATEIFHNPCLWQPFYPRHCDSTINTSDHRVGSVVGYFRPSSHIKMKAVFVLILVVFVTDVKPIFEEMSDMIFQKYATMKILEDCYGKETVNNMLREVALAYARCRGKPSFLPILEQIGSFGVVQASEEPAVTEAQPTTTAETTTTTPSSTTTAPVTDSPVKQAPFAIYRPSAVKIHQEIFDQNPRFGYDNRHFWYGYYPASQGSQFQQRYPYADFNNFYGGSGSPGSYRWKRSEHRALPEDTQETFEEVPLAPQSSQPAPPFSFLFANTLFSKQEAILGNVTCVMKEIGFIGEDMQLNYDNIRKRVDDLPVAVELKADLVDGIESCQQLTSCIPPKSFGDIPILKDIATPYAFFKCFKGRKIEACMKKDFREKFLALLSGVPSSRAKQMRDDNVSEVQLNVESIFNMVYGFGTNTLSARFF